MKIIANIGTAVLSFIYFILKLFPSGKKITLISRQSDDIPLDVQLLIDDENEILKNYKLIPLCKTMGKGLFQSFLYLFHIFRQMYHLATSKVVVLDSYCIPVSILKHKKQLRIVQMWHALGLMKKAGFSILDNEEGRSKSMAEALKMHNNYDFILTSSDACKPAFSEVFNADINKILTYPLPRLDYMKSKDKKDETIRKIMDRYDFLKNKDNILYAPTHRKNEEDLGEKINELIKEIDFEKYNLIVKCHPVSNIDMTSNNQILLDNEFSSLEMMTVSDIVITDYSALIYEGIIMNKKIYFYAFDLDKYLDARGFFIDYVNELPGQKHRSAASLFEDIKKNKYDFGEMTDFAQKYVDIDNDNCTYRIQEFVKSQA